MGAPMKYWLAALTLTLTRVVTAGEGGAAALVTDSSDQPVRGTSLDCWRSSLQAAGYPPACPPLTTSGASSIVNTTTSATGRTSASPLGPPPAAANSARTSPDNDAGYVTDTTGQVVRGSQGECWHTSAWSPALANRVGCDGVLARAVPVPAPAPSPKPQPPAAASSGPEAESNDALSPRQSAITPPTPAAEPAATPPAPTPRSGLDGAPVVPPAAPVPQAQQAPAPSSLTTDGNTARSDMTKKDAVPTTSKVTLSTDTYFDFDKSSLKPQGKRRLDALAARLIDMDLEVVVATGHTDATGSKTYNQRLSERRALTVKRYLVQKGIAGDRIFTEGKGEKQPVAPNSTRAGRAQNRRVDVELVGTPRR